MNMTREERCDAIKFFKEVSEKEVDNARYSRLAIEALEQEPKTEQYQKEIEHLHKYIAKLETQIVEHEPKTDVLDKIRAEMLEEMLSHSGTGEEVIQAYADGLKKGLDILDKCKAEIEE